MDNIYEQAQQDFYDYSLHGKGSSEPDASKGERYVQGWRDAEKAWEALDRPRTLAEFKAKAGELKREYGL